MGRAEHAGGKEADFWLSDFPYQGGGTGVRENAGRTLVPGKKGGINHAKDKKTGNYDNLEKGAAGEEWCQGRKRRPDAIGRWSGISGSVWRIGKR